MASAGERKISSSRRRDSDIIARCGVMADLWRHYGAYAGNNTPFRRHYSRLIECLGDYAQMSTSIGLARRRQ